MKPKATLLHLLALAGSSLLAVTSASAADLTWDITPGTVGVGDGSITGGTGTWNTTNGNWTADGGANNIAWNNANNDNAVIAGTATITIGVPVTTGTLTFTSSSVAGRTLSGSEITINNGMYLERLSSLNWTAPIKLGGSQTWTHNQINSNSTGKNITGTTNLNGSTLTWDMTNVQSNNRINHQNITGSGSIIKNGTGWLGLGGTNAYTGSTTINAGTIDAVSSTALGNANNQLTVNTGGTLNIAGNFGLTVGNLTGTGGVITTTGGNTNTRTLTVGSGDATGGNFQGQISDGSAPTALTKTGNGTITLSGTNTYSGDTTVSAGTLYVTGALSNSAATVEANGTVGSNGSTGSLGNGLTIEAGGNLDLTGATLGLNSTGILNLTGGSLTLGNLTFQDLVGWDWANASAGTYELIDGAFTIDWGSTAYLSEGTAYDFGNGNKGYFTSGSLNAVIVAIPEPRAALLGGLGLLALLRRRR